MEERPKIHDSRRCAEGEKLPLKSHDHRNGPVVVARSNDSIGKGTNDDEGMEDPQAPQEKEGFSCIKMSSRSRWTLVLVAMGMFANGCVFFVMVPFYTTAGVERGVSETVIGIVFSILHITIFVCSPLFGHFMPKIGARFMYVGGAMVAGFSTMIFGLVGYCGTGASFIVPSLMCRAMQAVGISASVTAAFAILAHEFPKTAATVFSITESFNGAGFMMGPVIGGALYEVGGFLVPFLVTGAIMVWNGIQLYVLLPLPKTSPNTHQGSPLSLTKSLLFDIGILNIFTATLAIQFLDPCLSIRLQQFGLSPSLVGLCYLTCPSVYGMVSPFIGYLTDVKKKPICLLVGGMFVLGIAMLLLGPCPGLTFLPNDLWLVIVSTGLIGITYGCAVAPVMTFMIRGAIEIGFPDHLDTYGLVSGSFYSMMCGGGVVGNIMGGALVDKYGFAFASMIFAFIVFATMLITLVYFVCRHLTRGHQGMESYDAMKDGKDNYGMVSQ